jgi:hypothetical protein
MDIAIGLLRQLSMRGEAAVDREWASGRGPAVSLDHLVGTR